MNDAPANAPIRPLNLPDLLPPVIDIARAAGEAIMPYFRRDADVERKDDYSPVTDADYAADAVIVPALEALTPDIPVVSEERRFPDIGRRFWLVDPLDGTKEFINDRPEFTVNIALVEDRKPVLGVLGVPTRGTVYAAAGPGTAIRVDKKGATSPIAGRDTPAAGIVLAISRSHAKKEEVADLVRDMKIADRIITGSAIKFCYIAEGRADFYPRIGPTSEWDTAAGHALLDATGGSLTMLDGSPFLYGKTDKNFLNPGFIARGRPV